MDIIYTRRAAIIAVTAAVVLIAVIAVVVFTGGSSTPTSTLPSGGTGTGTGPSVSTTYVPPVTNTPTAAQQVAKNEAVFLNQRITMKALELLGASNNLTQKIVDDAIAGTPGATNSTATLTAGHILLKTGVTIGGQVGYSCAALFGPTLHDGASIIPCP
jgi:hypothetical protein